MSITTITHLTATLPVQAYRSAEYDVVSDDGDIVRMKGYLAVDTDSVIVLDLNPGSSTTFTFDFQRIIQDNIAGYTEDGNGLPTIDSGMVFNASSCIVAMAATFTEVVDNAGVLEDGTSHTVVNTLYAIKAFVRHHENQNMSQFNMDGSTKRFLTDNSTNARNSIASRKIKLTEQAWLSLVNIAEAPAIPRIKYTKKTSGSLVTNYQTFSEFTSNKRVDIPAGPTNINTKIGSTFIDSDVIYYSITIVDNTTAISETITYVIDKTPTTEDVRVVWENRYGGLDFFTFVDQTRGINIDRQTYRKNLVRPGNPNSNFSTEDRSLVTLGGQSEIAFTAFTKPITNNERIWLEDLFEDRQAWIQNGTTDYIPIMVTSGDVKLVDKSASLYKIELSYKYANNNVIGGY